MVFTWPSTLPFETEAGQSRESWYSEQELRLALAQQAALAAERELEMPGAPVMSLKPYLCKVSAPLHMQLYIDAVYAGAWNWSSSRTRNAS